MTWVDSGDDLLQDAFVHALEQGAENLGAFARSSLFWVATKARRARVALYRRQLQYLTYGGKLRRSDAVEPVVHKSQKPHPQRATAIALAARLGPTAAARKLGLNAQTVKVWVFKEKRKTIESADDT